MAGAPDLFVANMLLVASDGLLTRVGSITSAGGNASLPWRPGVGRRAALEALIRGVFAAMKRCLTTCRFVCCLRGRTELGTFRRKGGGLSPVPPPCAKLARRFWRR